MLRIIFFIFISIVLYSLEVNAIDYKDNCNAVNDWDYNLTTKIVNKSFDLDILVKQNNSNVSNAQIFKIVFYEFNNSNCEGNYNEETICNNCGSTDSNGCFDLTNVLVDKAVKCVRVYIYAFKSLLPIPIPIPFLSDIGDGNSTDVFSLRPYKYEINITTPQPIKAGSEFNVTIKAVDYEGNATKDYNETINIKGNSPDLNYSDLKCKSGSLNSLTSLTFKNGEVNLTLVYDEVGEVNLSIEEFNDSYEFANVDENNSRESLNDLLIESNYSIVKFIPHHFSVDLAISNFDNNFTYLDNNLLIYSLLDLNITAENENNNTTTNYNSYCYAKNLDVNIIPLLLRHSVQINKIAIYKIKYVDNESPIYKNDKINFIIGESNFTNENNGSVLLKIYVNFERNISNPENPFEFNVSNIEVNDSDENLTYFNVNNNALFYYGFINLNDAITTKNDLNISHEIMLYDNNSSDTYKPSNSKEVILNWYLNTLNHQKDSNITNFVVTSGYVYDNNDLLNNINVKIININDSLSLEIIRSDSSVKFAVIHIIDTNATHLWYSKFNEEYNISIGSSCKNHFCFTITWNDNNISGVISGDIRGSKAKVSELNESKKGVKIFR